MGGGAGRGEGLREIGQPALPLIGDGGVRGGGRRRSGPQCTSKQPVVLVVPGILVVPVTPAFRLLGFYIYRYHSSMLCVLIWLISCLSACYYYSHSPV